MHKKIFYTLTMMILLVASVFPKTVINASQTTTIDMQNVNLPDALHILAKLMHENIILSAKVHGMVTLHLHKVSARKTFTLLLQSHDLFAVAMGNAWYITPREEWSQHQQDQLRTRETQDSLAPLATQVWRIHYAKADDVARLLQENNNSLLSKRGHLRVDTRTNILYIQDIAANIRQINFLIQRIDVPVQQVLIETHLASIESDYERNLGINFSVKNPSSSESQTNPAFSKTRYGLLVAKLADGTLLDVELSALENSGHGELISSPRLFTANQQAASIESGEEIPYQEESSSGGTSIAFKKAVLSLKVTPQILPGNKVLLQLQVNQDKPSKILIQGVPAINTRQINTSVLMRDGQTVVLGGIYESDQEQSRQAIPFLGSIPLLGLLFQQNNTNRNKRELLIFVTPRIISV